MAQGYAGERAHLTTRVAILAPVTPTLVVAIILAVAVIAFMSNRIPPGIVALGVPVALYLTGTLSLEQSLAGFGDPIVIYIATLFIVSEALDATGVTTWIGQFIIERTGEKPASAIAGLILLTAAVTALISVNGAVAALLPVGVVLAMKISQAPSRVLLPLAFAGHAGSLLTLMGSPVNLLVSDLAHDAGGRTFGFFEFALVGIPLVIGTLIIVVTLGPRLLPDRTASAMPRDLSQHAGMLAIDYDLDGHEIRLDRKGGMVEVVIPPRSSFIGEEVFAGMRTDGGELVVVAVMRGGKRVEQKTTVTQGDVLLLRGTWEAIDRNAAAGPDVIIVDSPRQLKSRAVVPGPRWRRAVTVLAILVLLLVLDVAPPAILTMCAAAAMILLRTITVAQAHRGISITTLVIMGGMIPLSQAMMITGMSDNIAGWLSQLLGDASPRLVILAISLATLVLGQFISNVATVLVMAPIALSVAGTLGSSPQPFMMALAVAGAAAFFTPIATPANTMIFAPGGYRFTDYWKLGLPLAVLYVTVAVVLVPIFWPF